jgi:hypothetical protein
MIIDFVKNDLRRLGGITIMIFGIVLLCFDFFKEDIKSTSDLYFVKLKLDKLPIERKTLHKPLGRYMYYLHTVGYPTSKFIIEDQFAQYFDNSKFENFAKENDSITIFIKQKDYLKIKNTQRISLFGITQGHYTYLDCDDTLNQYNSKLNYYLGISCLIIASLIFWYLRNK